MSEDVIDEIVTKNGGSTIDSAMLLAARDEMLRGLEEEANIALPPVQPGLMHGFQQDL
jgi:hypothetical protein